MNMNIDRSYEYILMNTIAALARGQSGLEEATSAIHILETFIIARICHGRFVNSRSRRRGYSYGKTCSFEILNG